jgi:hypothetical protein
MDISQTKALERVARVLAGFELSSNGDGDGRSVGPQVDEAWPSYLESASAILHTLREPDASMVAVGDAKTWSRMVRAALGEDVEPAGDGAAVQQREIYQTPLG